MVRNVEPELRPAVIAAPQFITQRTLGNLERLMEQAIAEKPDVIDMALGNVQGIDSAGLGWLVGVQERLSGLGMKLRLADPTELIQDILMATRLDTRFAVHCTTGSGRHA